MPAALEALLAAEHPSGAELRSPLLAASPMPLSSAGPSAGSADGRVRGVWGAEEGAGSPLAAPAPALARVAALAVGRVSGMLRPAAPVAGEDAAEREQGRRDDGRYPSLMRPKSLLAFARAVSLLQPHRPKARCLRARGFGRCPERPGTRERLVVREIPV